MPFDPAVFDDIEAKLESLDIDEIKLRLSPLMIGFHIQMPIFDAGTFLYRARKLSPQFRKEDGITRADLIYPNAAKSNLGRLNRLGNPVFYAGMQKETPFFEIPGISAGDDLILTYWKTTERMLVNNIGYTEHAFEQLGAKRPVPDWYAPTLNSQSSEQTLSLLTLSKEVAEIAMSIDDAGELKKAFSKYFTRQVNADESFRYKLTTAIGELHLGDIKNQKAKFAGILYPSVRMWANGDNVALQPWFVDDHLEFRKAIHVRIRETRETAFDIDYLDVAHAFDEIGVLKWLGRLKNWTLKPLQKAKAEFVSGTDDDGDYYISKEGQPAHWVLADLDTSEIIEPA